MRIITGKGKGTKLFTKKGESTRPTSDRVKESVFSIISEDLKDAIILDLFAGSGALGLEALSRGAAYVVFCEYDKESIEIIKKNIKKTHNEIGRNIDLYHINALDFLKKTEKKFDLIFLDPPYNYDINNFLEIIHKKRILKNSGLIVYETESDIKEFENFEIIDKRKYGRPYIIFLKNKRGNNGSI